MQRAYTTQELIQILHRERIACMQGDRLNLAVTAAGLDSSLDRVLGRLVRTDGVQKFTAYQDFRSTIHKYQLSHNVSGIVWQTLRVTAQTLHYPRIHDQLIAIPRDLEFLAAAREDMVAFWLRVTQEMALFLSFNGGKRYQRIESTELQPMIARAEWAGLHQQGRDRTLELILQLGWGQPAIAQNRRGWPHSGSELIHAVQPGMQPLA